MKIIIKRMENSHDRGVWIRILFFDQSRKKIMDPDPESWIRIRSLSDRIQNPACSMIRDNTPTHPKDCGRMRRLPRLSSSSLSALLRSCFKLSDSRSLEKNSYQHKFQWFGSAMISQGGSRYLHRNDTILVWISSNTNQTESIRFDIYNSTQPYRTEHSFTVLCHSIILPKIYIRIIAYQSNYIPD